MQDIKVKFAYKTGFRRLWLVVSLLWLIVVTYVVATDRNLHVFDWVQAGLLPVLALYAIGAAFVWIIEGFARADR